MQESLPKAPFKVKAVYSWSGEHEQDLGFLESDIIEVTKVKGNWLYGRLLRNKKSGYFPVNYVQVLYEVPNGYIERSPAEPRTQRPPTPPTVSAPAVLLPAMPTRSPKSMEKGDLYGHGPHSPALTPAESPRRRMHLEPGMRAGSRLPITHLPKSHSTNMLAPRIEYPVRAPRLRSGKLTPGPEPAKRASSSECSSNTGTTFSRRARSKSDLPPLPPIPPIPNVTLNVDTEYALDFGHPHTAELATDAPNNNDNHNKLRERHGVYNGEYPTTRSYNDLAIARSPQRHTPRNDGYSSSYGSNYEGYEGYSSGYSDGYAQNQISQSRFLEDSLGMSEDSYCLMSDFSATSAGSFARHRFARSFADSTEEDNYPSSPRDISSPSKVSGVFRKFLGSGYQLTGNHSSINIKGGLPKLPDLHNLNIADDEGSHWLQAQCHLHRSNTLSAKEKRERERRVLYENSDVVLRPQDYINEEINTNDVYHSHKPGLVDIELKSMDLENVDYRTRRRCQQTGPFTVESFAHYNFRSGYRSPIEQLRGIFTFCTEFFRLIDDGGKTDFNSTPTNLDSVLHSLCCTPYELTWIFKKMANSLGIQCDLVVGLLKTPNADNMTFRFNHCWLRVLVADEMRFVDVILGNVTNPLHEYINNKKQVQGEDFYFLIQPLHLIYTHVPYLYEEQHIVPAIDRCIAMCLPVVFPSFFKNDLRLYKYSLGLCELLDSEIFECSIKVPSDVELVSSVVPEGSAAARCRNLNLSLVQYKLHKRDRIALIKAVLPPGLSAGTLHIHSGIRGLHDDAMPPLSMIVPLTHSGTSKEYEFVARFPCPDAQKIDMYIKEPQNKYLFSGTEYTFQIICSPADGLTHDPYDAQAAAPNVIVVQSPSGKIYRLKKAESDVEFGVCEARLKVHEPGVWLALITSEAGAGWCTFAKWICV
ncbi:FADL288Cp [Eremothecium gossypii FDAG1]|nr:FADL288Cp [Eremothecium gossypii FDAG1]